MATWLRGEFGDDDDTETWMRAQNEKAAWLSDPRTDALQRQAWNHSTRTGDNLVARTPSELRALPIARRVGGSAARESVGNQIVGRLRAGARGATDAITVGHGAETEAALSAIPSVLSGNGFAPKYRVTSARMSARRAIVK